jgi:hypothetical protein
MTVDLQQREYNALITISKTFSINTNTNKDNDDNGDEGFGIIFTSKSAILALSQTFYKDDVTNSNDVNDDDSNRICIFTTVLNPIIEFYATSTQVSSSSLPSLSSLSLSLLSSL